MNDGNLDWYTSSLGRVITECEAEISARLVPQVYYRVCVQVEGPASLDYFINIQSLIRCQVTKARNLPLHSSVVGLEQWLPFGEQSIDFLVLPHVLDFTDSPQEVLREASHCLNTNGVLLVTGFNPRSMLKINNQFKKFENKWFNNAHFHPVRRVRNWLMATGFEVFAGEFGFYRPPVQQIMYLKKLQKIEIAGARWWPALGAVYILASRKQDLGIRILPKFSQARIKRSDFGLEYKV